MSIQVHIHPKVEKKLEQLKKKSNAPLIAAERAEKIIQALVKGDRIIFAGRLSKSKDARIKDLFKYNLGKGYRLVCSKNNSNIYVLFIGSHDNCDTWIDKHRKKKLYKIKLSMNVHDVKTNSANPFPEIPDAPNGNEQEHSPIPEIKQQDLRKIFQGLTVNTKINNN